MHYSNIILLQVIFPNWKDALHYNSSNAFLSIKNVVMGLLFLSTLESNNEADSGKWENPSRFQLKELRKSDSFVVRPCWKPQEKRKNNISVPTDMKEDKGHPLPLCTPNYHYFQLE